MKYALIDTANTFFRARHVASRNSTLEEKIGMALHLTLASVNQAVKRYGIDHVVFCLEGKSWRKAVYEPYKKNRIVDFYSRRPNIQESLTKQIHDHIDRLCIGIYIKGIVIIRHYIRSYSFSRY